MNLREIWLTAVVLGAPAMGLAQSPEVPPTEPSPAPPPGEPIAPADAGPGAEPVPSLAPTEPAAPAAAVDPAAGGGWGDLATIPGDGGSASMFRTWDAVRKAATARGVPARTPDELVAAMFSDGLSTRTAVSELSGRGVGLGALRRAVLDLGGTIEIESKPGRGTCLRFVFDERRVEASSVSRRRQRSSLLPMVH